MTKKINCLIQNYYFLNTLSITNFYAFYANQNMRTAEHLINKGNLSNFTLHLRFIFCNLFRKWHFYSCINMRNMQDFCIFTHKIMHIITLDNAKLSLKGLTACFLKFLKTMKSFIYKEFHAFIKIKLPFSCHFFKFFP